MTNNANTNITLTQAVRKSAIGLAIFAFFTAGIIAITQVSTKETISINEKAFEARLLLSLLPSGFEANQLLDSAREFKGANLQKVSSLHVSPDDLYYVAKNKSGTIEAFIFPVVAPEGYSEPIRLIVGITPNGEVIGVRVTKHKETPGLGDQVEITKSDWIYNFDGKSLSLPSLDMWQVKKDGGAFDQLTGATITPRAIVKAVRDTLQFFELNRDALLANSK